MMFHWVVAHLPKNRKLIVSSKAWGSQRPQFASLLAPSAYLAAHVEAVQRKCWTASGLHSPTGMKIGTICLYERGRLPQIKSPELR